MARHGDLTSVHQFAIIAATDPGAVGAGKAWLDTSGGTAAPVLRVRNAADSGWDAARSAASPHHTTHEVGGIDPIAAAALAGFDPQVRLNRLDQLAAPAADVSLASHKLINVIDPTGNQDAATKSYVDAAVLGLSWKASVRVATTVAGALATAFANGQTVDGVALATGDRVLVKNQAAGAENGIYVVAASGAPTRATDADSASDILQASVFVREGTVNADTQWTLTTNSPITIGATALTFTQLSTGATVSAGPGIAVAAGVVSLSIATLPTIVPDPAADFLPLYDTSGALIGKATPNTLGVSSGGSNNPGGTPFNLPQSTAFAFVSDSYNPAFISSALGSLKFLPGAGTQVAEQVLPATPHTVVMAFRLDHVQSQLARFGLMRRRTADDTGEGMFWTPQTNGSKRIDRYYGGPGAHNGPPGSFISETALTDAAWAYTDVHWFKFTDDGTTLKWFISMFGDLWTQWDSNGHAARIGTADRVAAVTHAIGSQAATVLHFQISSGIV